MRMLNLRFVRLAAAVLLASLWCTAAGCGDDSSQNGNNNENVDGGTRDGGADRDAAPTDICNNAGLQGEEVGPQPPGQCVTSGGIDVTGCGVLDQQGATYRLTQDVESAGTCIAIAGSDVTFDLCGYTVTYGTGPGERMYGIAVPPGYQDDAFPGLPPEAFGGADRVTVTNGRVVQAEGTDQWRHGMYMRGCAECTIHNMEITVDDPDSYNLYFRYCAGLDIAFNHLINHVTSVENRHYPGNHVINLPNIADGTFDVHHNLIQGGAQWGIYLSDDDGNSATVTCHHNEIRHDTKVTNGYGIGAHADNLNVYANLIIPASGRGIHVTGDNDRIHENCLDVRELPNPEYPQGIQAHGIKLEGATNARVEYNHVWSWGLDGYGPGDALDFGHSETNVVLGGEYYGPTQSASDHWGAANVLIGVEEGSGNVVRDALLSSNHNIIRVTWDGGGGILYDGCTFLLTDDGPRTPHTISIQIGHNYYARDLIFRDIVLEGVAALDDIDFLYSDYTWDQVALTIQWTATITVEDSGQNPVQDAEVVILDADAVEVFRSNTAADGTVQVPLTHYIQHQDDPLENGREYKTPHQVTVTPPGGGNPVVDQIAADGPGAALTVTLP